MSYGKYTHLEHLIEYLHKTLKYNSAIFLLNLLSPRSESETRFAAEDVDAQEVPGTASWCVTTTGENLTEGGGIKYKKRKHGAICTNLTVEDGYVK